MNKDVAQKATRGVSPILLVLAALCFLLPFVGVSCNSSAQAALGPALNSLGTAGGAQSAQATQCLQSLSNHDLFTYSGLNLTFGGRPSSDVSNIQGCSDSSAASPSPSGSGTGSSSSSTAIPPATLDMGNVGAQPILIAALVLIAVGFVATLLPGLVRNAVAGGAALIALVLVIVGNSSVHGTVAQHVSAIVTSSGGSADQLSQLGITSGLDTFFNIHAAIGFTLILTALGLALLVNVGGALAGLRLTVSTAPSGAPPTGDFTWPSAPGGGSGPAPPPSSTLPPPSPPRA